MESEEEAKHAHSIEEYLIMRGAMVNLKPIHIDSPSWEKPLDVFEQAFALECQYRELLEQLVLLAKQENDELTAQHMLKMLDDQVNSCNEFEILLNKAKAYSSLTGLFYHLDAELRKKAKKAKKD